MRLSDTIREWTLNGPKDNLIRNLWCTLITRFQRGRFLRNVTIISSGTAITQGIQAAASPILTRLYSPADFGILSVYLSVVPILTILFTLHYSLAIVLPREDKDAKALLGMVVRVAAMLCLITFALTLSVKFIGLERFVLKGIPWVIMPLIAVASFINVLVDTCNFWNIRVKSFTLVSTALVSGAIVAALLNIGMGLLGAGWRGLIAGMLFGNVVNFLVQLFHGNRLKVFKNSFAISADRPFARAVLKEYSDFPKYRLPQNLLNTTSNHLPAIMLVAFFGPTVGGFYALCQRLVVLPSLLISDAMNKVFYQKAADLGNRDLDLFVPTLKTILGLAVVGIIPFGAIALLGPVLFPVVFGETWRIAGVYMVWLSVPAFFRFCYTPVIAAIPAVGLQRQFLLFETVLFATRVLSLGAGAIAGKAIVAVALYAVSSAVFSLFLVLFVLGQLRRGVIHSNR